MAKRKGVVERTGRPECPLRTEVGSVCAVGTSPRPSGVIVENPTFPVSPSPQLPHQENPTTPLSEGQAKGEKITIENTF